MSKAGKRGKSGDVKGGPAGGGKWDQVLSSCAFQEESWNPCVTWVVGRQAEDSKHIEALNVIVQTGTRKLFSVVTKDLLFADVRELGNPKNKKVKETPANSEICESCKPYVDTGEPIPVPLLAKLIKWKLMAIKAADLKRRDAEMKALKAKAANDKKKGAKDAKDAGKDRAKSPKKGGKKTPEPQTAKDGSKLRKRGEEDSDNKYIDDEPDDGSDHYILVSGFHDPRLFQFMEEIRVTVDSVIGIGSQDYTPLKRPPPPEMEPPAEPTEEDRKFEELQNELRVFWTDLLPLLQRLPDSSSLHDIARLDYQVKALMVPSDPMDTEQKVQYSTSLFEDIAVMIYDLLDARRLYRTYLENLKLTRVPVYGVEETTAITPVPPPTPGQPGAVPGAAGATDMGASMTTPEHRVPPPPVDMRYYNDLMNTVPQESVSVPLILHCMLEQVTANEDGRDPPSEQAPPTRPDGLNFHLATYLTGVAFKLGLSESEHQMLSEVLELPSPPPDQPGPPELINVQDDIGNRTQHLQAHYGFNPAAVEKVMLQFVPYAKLWQQQQRPTSAESRLRAARLQELIHYCARENLHKSEIDRAFKQFVFESMDLAKVDANGFILEKGKEGLHQTAVPWDDPYPFFKVMLPQARRLSADLRYTPVSTEESRSAMNLHGQPSLQPAKIQSFTGKLNGTKFGGTGRGACTPEIPEGDRDSKHGSISGDEGRKKSILVSSSKVSSPRNGLCSPKQSRSNSVHWEADLSAKEVLQDLEDPELPLDIRAKTVEEGVLEMVDAQQRNLDQWCFAEHFKPDILLQVLREASYMLPFYEIYHHKRDETQMLVLHNPYGAELHNHVDWHQELHSNMGFRNYLDCTAESISEWLKEKEAEYQAHVLSKEVESINKEEEEKAKAAEKADAKGKKSPRKSPSRSKSPKGSRSSSLDRSSSQSDNPYVRTGSLKAWQAEQDKIAQGEDEKERAKAEKRSRSATKLKEKEEKEKAEKEKAANKSPRGSARSRKSASTDVEQSAAPASQPEPTGEQAEEAYWPFYGYDSGNQLIHVSGIKTTLFPSDGGTIKTERTEFVHGTTAIQSVLQKDDHVFAIHVLNPREDMDLPDEYEALLESQAMAAVQATSGSAPQEGREGFESALTEETSTDPRRDAYTGEKSEFEKSEKEDLEKPSATPREDGTDTVRSRAHRPAVSQFGSITAQLSDGMVLALSQFGSTGESYLKPYQPAQYIPPPNLIESASAPQTAASPSKGKKEAPKKGQTPEVEKPAGDETDNIEDEKKDEEKQMPKQDFQELFVTCPDGLSVKYFLQSSIGVSPPSPDDRQLAVRQSYPYKTKGVQNCEAARNKYVQTEVARVITAEGNVVKNMVDGSVEVMSADGTVSRFSGVWQMSPSRAASPARSTKSDQPGRDSPKKGGKNSAKNRRQANQPEVEVEEEVKLEGAAPTWTITYPSGERLQINKETGDCQELSTIPVCLATDPDTSQTMATRDDHVITVSYPDGTTVVEHADGTRITVYYRETAVPADDNDEASSTAISTQTLKFVKVECPAFATVEFNTATSENLTVFGSGTSINVFPDGYYILHHSKGGRVEVDTEGTMVYFPRRSRFLEHLMPERELQYVLRHNADVILETVDPDGNVFNVRSTGDFNVIPVQADDACSDDSDENNASKAKKITQYGQHAPRFFIIHGDSSGTELLRYQDVAEYLMLAEQNPATAVLKDALPDHPGVKGITVLKPYLLGLSEKWFKNYDQESIVPKGIRCRDLKTLPPKEYVKPGPKFGTNVGQGLSVGAVNKGPVRVPILKCPNKLELRQVVQYKPMADSLREVLKEGLRSYAEAVVGRMRAEALTNIDDVRSVDEKILAQDLRVLADAQRQEAKDCEPEHVKSIYEAAVAPPPPSPPHTPQPKRTLADWERDRREREEEAEAKTKLKHKSIEPYFTSELGKAFLLTQASDMEDMMRQLSEDPRRDGTEAVRGDLNESRLTYTHSPMYNNNPPVPPSQPRASVLSDRSVTSESPGTQRNNKNGQETPLSYTAGMSEAATVTPSRGVRPHNPTPAHATGQGSPAPVRPHNPTPAHAGKIQTDRPGNPTPKIALGVETPSEYEPSRGEYPMILEHPWEEEDTQLTSADRELARQRALTTNVVGEPRTESVQLPGSIKGGRPGAMPNVKYHNIEDPVRRQVRTSLVAGAEQRGRMPQLAGMRGLICQPEGVNFGVLKEGCTYRYSVMLRNTGVDTCRYKIRQPPPATGLRVIYKPGPVAAGMCVELALELYAIANGVEGESGVGSLGHVLEIITETDVLELPIVATILTAHEYDNPAVSHAGMRNTNARLVSTRPPASTGIIRPRRDNRTAVPS